MITCITDYNTASRRQGVVSTNGYHSPMAAMDAQLDVFRVGDFVTLRDRPDTWQVVDMHDPRGLIDNRLPDCCPHDPRDHQTTRHPISCIPLVQCKAVTAVVLTDEALWFEPRDLHLVSRGAEGRAA
jgi:hypothetical protein